MEMDGAVLVFEAQEVSDGSELQVQVQVLVIVSCLL